MQIVINIGLVAVVSLAASFLLLAKLHRQLSHMIEGRIYQERAQNWPDGVHAKYRASSKELILHAVSFGLLGIAVGLLVYAGQQVVLSLIAGALALVVFYLLTKEIRRNFPIEEERNRSVFDGKKRR
jgi:hypothetical protein